MWLSVGLSAPASPHLTQPEPAPGQQLQLLCWPRPPPGVVCHSLNGPTAQQACVSFLIQLFILQSCFFFCTFFCVSLTQLQTCWRNLKTHFRPAPQVTCSGGAALLAPCLGRPGPLMVPAGSPWDTLGLISWSLCFWNAVFSCRVVYFLVFTEYILEWLSEKRCIRDRL